MVPTKFNLGQPNIPIMGSHSRKSTANKWDSDQKNMVNTICSKEAKCAQIELNVPKSTEID